MPTRRTPGTVNLFDLWRKRDGSPTSRNGKGKRWRVTWVDLNREQRTQSFDRKADAQAHEKRLIAQFNRGDYIDPNTAETTVSDVYALWEPTTVYLKPKTRHDRRSTWTAHINDAWGTRRIGAITKSDVVEWVAEQHHNQVGARTIEKNVALLRLVLGHAVDAGLLRANPADKVKTPRTVGRRHVYLTVAQVNRLATELGEYGTLIRLLAFTGLRWGEATALRVEDIDFGRRRLNVHRNDENDGGKLIEGTPKSHTARTVPWPESLRAELEGAVVGKGNLDRVFTSDTGRPLNGSNFRSRQFVPALSRARTANGGAVDESFPVIVVHDLRHTAASLAVASGASVLAVQRMLGHKSASMTLDVYSDLFDTDLDDVAVRMDEIVAAG